MTSLFLNGSTESIADSINLGTPKVNASGGKNIPIFYKPARTGLKVETPLMMTWGINSNQFDAKTTYDMSLQFPSAEFAREDTSAFLENLKRLEMYIKEQACSNSKAWFGKVQSAEVIEAFWTPMLRYPKDKATNEPDYTKSPTFRAKIPFWDGQFKCEIYNVHRELIFPKEGVNILDVVPKGSEVKVMLQCGGIWFAGGKFGITWKPYQMIVKPKHQLTPGVCHLSSIPVSVRDDTVRPSDPADNLRIDVSEMIESDEDIDREYKEPEPIVQDPQPASDVPEVPVKGRRKVVKS
jgi:hypothetical protein